ncbi:hypothetical protein K438DRAFT_2086142 [Mycena galopus ATCC 62051]|nr:hypothetical protein K438DRAFT_2086142 [Mycena galopus ATCC 62051]
MQIPDREEKRERSGMSLRPETETASITRESPPAETNKIKSSHVHGGVGARSEGCPGGKRPEIAERKTTRAQGGVRCRQGAGRAPVSLCPAVRHPPQSQPRRAQPSPTPGPSAHGTEREGTRTGKERERKKGTNEKNGDEGEGEHERKKFKRDAGLTKNAKHGKASPMRGPRFALPDSDPDGARESENTQKRKRREHEKANVKRPEHEKQKYMKKENTNEKTARELHLVCDAEMKQRRNKSGGAGRSGACEHDRKKKEIGRKEDGRGREHGCCEWIMTGRDQFDDVLMDRRIFCCGKSENGRNAEAGQAWEYLEQLRFTVR